MEGVTFYLYCMKRKRYEKSLTLTSFLFFGILNIHKRWKGNVVYILNKNQVTKNGGDLEIYIWLASTNRIY